MAKVSLRAYNREIEAMIDRGHLDEAVAHCQHILKTFPKHLETYRLLGKAYLEARRHNEAVDIFSRVLNAEPTDFVAHVGMSIIRDEQNKLDDAIWHMERAFEVQSANPAIQAELQRLYGRRDGVQPPRIRMTRGALAHMYMRGELFPQAISESKGVLEEDQGRTDMQALLAKAYFRSGQKKDAADAASGVLKRFPFCLDANLVLAEIFGTDRPESAHVYRQRVIELDPYASQTVDNMFLAGEVSDAAISLDHLEWNGQPVGVSGDWGTEHAIGLESGISDREEQPDWLKESYSSEVSSLPSAPALASGQDAFSSPAQPADENIPDFLRAAGWGASSGAFDESKSSAMFDDESASPAAPIAQGDLPDWVKAMAPQETAQPAEGQEEEMPDWIDKIGTGALAVPSVGSSSSDDTDWLGGLGELETEKSEDQSDWMKDSGGEQTASQPAEGQPDWMTGFGSDEEQPAIQPSDEQPDWLKDAGEVQPVSTADEQPDWLKGFGEEQADAQSSAEQPDWLKGFGEEQPAAQPSAEQPDWMKESEEEQPALQPSDEQLDWLRGISAESVPSPTSSDLDFLDELTREPEESAPTPSSKIDTGRLGTSEAEQDDSFAWLENLAAKQGATEGLLTKPEERLEDEPDWIKQAKSLSRPASQPVLDQPSQELSQPPVQQVPDEQIPVEELTLEPEPTSPIQPVGSIEDLGRSESEIDDALAWFEGLAARQGATEGLLTKPEERREQEPDWVKEVKKRTGELQPPPVHEVPVQQPVEETPPPVVSQPVANVEDLGKGSQEIDDALAWFEGLAARQGATEGLLTKPEERREQEPDWVKQAKSAGVQEPQVQQPAAEEKEYVPEPAPAADEFISAEEGVSSWLKSLDEKEAQETAAVAADDMPSWLKSLDEPEEAPAAAVLGAEDLPAWMRGASEEEVPEPEPAVPVEEALEVSESIASVQESESEEIPAWLGSLEGEEAAPAIPALDDLPSWMRDETGEVVAEPTKIEPIRSADWKPVAEKVEEPVQPPPPAAEPVTLEPKPEPKAKKPAPIKKEAVKPAAPPEPYHEPVTIKGTGMLTMPADPILGSARTELSRSNIPGALEAYGKLIKKGRYLEEVIFDLREALYRYPVEVSIWQALGDAYMRANQLQDALDAYTKAEELLR